MHPDGEIVELFRAVQPAELSDLQKSGKFRIPPGGNECKYFCRSAAGACKFGEMAQATYKDGPYTVVKTTGPRWIINDIDHVDRGLDAVIIYEEHLQLLAPFEIMDAAHS